MYVLAKCVLIASAAIAASGFTLRDNDVVFHLYTSNFGTIPVGLDTFPTLKLDVEYRNAFLAFIEDVAKRAGSNPTISEPLLPSVMSIMTSSFSLGRRTVITIHSHGEGVGGNFNAFVVPAHLAADDVNILAVDWSPGSSLYTQGLGNAPQCGEIIANFVNILVGQFGYDPELIRIVGVGLGGHIAGIAARKINGEIPHIIAIDPSFHGWTHHPDKLNADDAPVVEVLHATVGCLGYDLPLGDIDFYPNGGCAQGNCDGSCTHTFGYAFYAESITSEISGGNSFVGTACDTYEDAIALRCSGARDAIFGGRAVKSDASGIYGFLTNLVPPYARG